MTYDFRPAKRENVPLLIGVAGGTGSGKTLSALRIARGLAGGDVIAGIDTENGRMNHYADDFPELRRAGLTKPYRPDAYSEAVAAAVAFLKSEQVPPQHRVVLIDSASHEWAGDGGCLDWHAELTGGDPKKSPVGWAKVKPAHKRFVTRLLQVEAHVILCFRAEPKVEIVRNAKGDIEFVDAKAPGKALDGWMPIAEKMLPYEMTASFMLFADQPGVPKPIKLEGQHKPFVPLDKVLDEQVGKKLGEWAAGGGAVVPSAQGGAVTPPAPPASDVDKLADRLVELATELGAREATEDAIGRNREKAGEDIAAHEKWLRRSIAAAEQNVAAKAAASEGDAVEPDGPADGDAGTSAAPSEAADDGSLFERYVPKGARS